MGPSTDGHRKFQLIKVYSDRRTFLLELTSGFTGFEIIKALKAPTQKRQFIDMQVWRLRSLSEERHRQSKECSSEKRS